MVLLQMITGVVSISKVSPTDSDYIINGNELGYFNLTEIVPFYKWYFQVVVVTTRYYYQANSVLVSQEFDSAGLYNLSAIIYDQATQSVKLQNNYIVNGLL